ncbi:hypothetical protein K1T35_48355 (plasmid) [Pseudonocardia sp. DSM 110487]|uniref:hypothetical protein n=1 Tax=Pseudonocardia sp. DSM 110487 TaxID=2865833 RepID=UPI001C696BFB|nr:hypothetical protein [Pseudonocardia sp. DSM 110487]QYN41161.1 hypothetical protein K1T35_48355 [Pseudonocardia sp. DSM 110487]
MLLAGGRTLLFGHLFGCGVRVPAAASEDDPMDEHDDTPELAPAPTVHDRLRTYLSEERIQAHFKAGSIRVGDQVVTDLNQPAPPPARPVILPF